MSSVFLQLVSSVNKECKTQVDHPCLLLFSFNHGTPRIDGAGPEQARRHKAPPSVT